MNSFPGTNPVPIAVFGKGYTGLPRNSGSMNVLSWCTLVLRAYDKMTGRYQ
jgi:hypothetical protein